MISQSYYNKYRPKTFKDIRGSKSAEILETQIKNNRTTHAYILAGPPGTGKTKGNTFPSKSDGNPSFNIQ